MFIVLYHLWLYIPSFVTGSVHSCAISTTGYRLAAEVNRQHSGCVCIPSRGRSESAALGVLPIHFGRETVPSYTHTPRVLPIHFGRETVYTHTPSAADSLRPRDGTQWFQLHEEHTFLQPFRPIELISHIAITVLQGTQWRIWGQSTETLSQD